MLPGEAPRTSIGRRSGLDVNVHAYVCVCGCVLVCASVCAHEYPSQLK